MSQILKKAPKTYHHALVALHWVVALLIFANISLAVALESGGRDLAGIPLINFHMTFGITILILMITRLSVRFIFQRPAAADAGNPILNKIGEATHWLLYLLTFGMTISGLILAIETDDLPQLLGAISAEASSRGLANLNLGWLHGRIWALLLLLILLHIGAAIYHQFILKDNLIKRMGFGKRYD